MAVSSARAERAFEGFAPAAMSSNPSAFQRAPQKVPLPAAVAQQQCSPPSQQPPQQQRQHEKRSARGGAGRRRAQAAAAQPFAGVPGASAATAVSPWAIASAVESLYRDQLRPYGRLVRKRIEEQAAAQGAPEPSELGAKQLRAACEAIQWLTVEDAEGAEWAALLVGQPQNFVDVYSPDDVYPARLWAEAAAYFESLRDEESVFPGGRYMCAQVMAQRNLPFLRGYSLGQVSHIVQLAISKKKLLGYSNGVLVPYAQSQSMLKDRHAEFQQPCPAAARGKAAPVATWSNMRAQMQHLIKSSTDPQGQIPLSNIKRLFRTLFGVELSETALGYSKLSELLQDPRLSDLCDVKLQGYGYVLLPMAKPAQRNRISLVDGLCLDHGLDHDFGPQQVSALHSAVATDFFAPDALTSAAALEHTMPAPMASPQSDRMRWRPQPLCLDEAASQPTSPSRRDAVDDRLFLGDGQMDGAHDLVPLLSTTPTPLGTPFGAVFPPTPFPPTPSPSAAYGMSLPRLLGSIRAVPPGLEEADLSHEPAKVHIAPPSPQCLAGDGFSFASVDERQWELRPLTPSTLGSFGLSVQNTFLHAPKPPPTPMKVQSRLRARSAPRNA